MDAMLDTLAASRKLEESGMPEPQAGAVVEVVNDAMKNLVTKQHLKIELDRSFKKFERKIDRKLDERFGTVEEKFEKMDERFEKMDERFEKMDEKFEKMDEKFSRKFERNDGRFEKIDASLNELKLSIAELGKSQAWGFVYVCGITIAVAALLFTALQYFGTGATAAPMYFPQSDVFGDGTSEFFATPPGIEPTPPPESALEPDPAVGL